MRMLSFAGLAGIATAVHAQQTPLSIVQPASEPLVVTATRLLEPAPTLRDAVVITRDDLEQSSALTLAEVLQRRAGVEIRGLGGAGQPQSIFVRGAGSAQTLVLVDGMRVGSATAGTTAIEHIPLELIERIEVVKGPMSSLYGSDAIGGVIQIFTRRKNAPYLFASAGIGTDGDQRVAAGLETVDRGMTASLTLGARRADPRSATNARSPFFNPDRDRYDDAFANVRLAQTLWQGETIELEAFGTHAHTHFDSARTELTDARDTQTVMGARLTSSNHFLPWWASKLAIGQGRDRLISFFTGSDENFNPVAVRDQIETRQDQASWINEFTLAETTKVLAGAEILRQRVLGDTAFAVTTRNTNSVFGGINQAIGPTRFEASVRRDDDEQFGERTTGSASYGVDVPSLGRIAATYGRGFRAPTFNDLYFPGFANPDLRPERSRSWEVSWKASAGPVRWGVTGYDNRFEDLIVFDNDRNRPENVAAARVRGVEITAEGTWLGTRVRGDLTLQRPRDEATGKQLRSRAQRFGSLDASRSFGAWTAGATVSATSVRFDSFDDSPDSRLPGHVVVDARLRYRWAKHWSVELSGANLANRRYENAVGYDAPRRSVFLNLRFEAF
jgi:vitamin B12 transporter